MLNKKVTGFTGKEVSNGCDYFGDFIVPQGYWDVRTHTNVSLLLVSDTKVCVCVSVPVSYTHLDVYKRQQLQYEMINTVR